MRGRCDVCGRVTDLWEFEEPEATFWGVCSADCEIEVQKAAPLLKTD